MNVKYLMQWKPLSEISKWDRPRKTDHIIRMIKISVITLSDFQCIMEFIFWWNDRFSLKICYPNLIKDLNFNYGAVPVIFCFHKLDLFKSPLNNVVT